MKQYVLENDVLRIAVNTHGAELASVQNKADGREMMWQADPAVWNRHAPLLFPYCGGLWDNTLLAKGREYAAPKHGFARDMEFVCTVHDENALVFVLESNDKTAAYFPYEFRLEVEYTLRNNMLNQKVKVHNSSTQEELPFSVGFHPGFALPFDKNYTTEDYQFVFEHSESPQLVHTPGGYVSGEVEELFHNSTELPLTDTLFANDSLCLQRLDSCTLALREKATNRKVQVTIANFPYVLLWGPATGPLPFACIEPWHSLPDGPERYGEFKNKPGLTLLPPKEWWDTTLQMTFVC